LIIQIKAVPWEQPLATCFCMGVQAVVILFPG